MANRKRAEARRKAQAKAGNGGGSINPKVWIAAAAAVILIVVAVVIFSGDDDKDANNGSDTTEQTGSQFPDSQPVTITGESLPAFVTNTAPEADVGVGMPAPALTGLNFQGDAVDINPATDGKPYMVVFLAHWCPHCNAEVPRLLDWKNSGAVPSNLNVIGVATASAEGAANYPPASWFSNKGWSWPVLVDELGTPGEAGKAAIAYGASGWPYFVIVGADGLVKARHSGEIEIGPLQDLVDTALAS